METSQAGGASRAPGLDLVQAFGVSASRGAAMPRRRRVLRPYPKAFQAFEDLGNRENSLLCVRLR